MARYAVGFYSLFDNELTIKIVEAADWYSAMKKHPALAEYELPATSLEDAKKEAFNCDAGLDVVEIL